MNGTELLKLMAEPGAYVERVLASFRFVLHVDGRSTVVPDAIFNVLQGSNYAQQEPDKPGSGALFRITDEGRKALKRDTPQP